MFGKPKSPETFKITVGPYASAETEWEERWFWEAKGSRGTTNSYGVFPRDLYHCTDYEYIPQGHWKTRAEAEAAAERWVWAVQKFQMKKYMARASDKDRKARDVVYEIDNTAAIRGALLQEQITELEAENDRLTHRIEELQK